MREICENSKFHDFSRPGFYFFIFHGFPWFSMTVEPYKNHRKSVYSEMWRDHARLQLRIGRGHLGLVTRSTSSPVCRHIGLLDWSAAMLANCPLQLPILYLYSRLGDGEQITSLTLRFLVLSLLIIVALRIKPVLSVAHFVTRSAAAPF